MLSYELLLVLLLLRQLLLVLLFSLRVLLFVGLLPLVLVP